MSIDIEPDTGFEGVSGPQVVVALDCAAGAHLAVVLELFPHVGYTAFYDVVED